MVGNPCLHYGPMRSPLAYGAELSVNVVPGVREGEALERPAQNLLVDDPSASTINNA